MSKNELLKYKKNFFSQSGEDGIIKEIFRRIEFRSTIKLDKKCCEFGAWNGIHLSNTFNLIKNYHYEAILIEGDKKRFQELCKNLPEKKIIKVNKFVKFSGENKLDNILNKYSFPKNFDFLSIDIDGNDYHIFKGLNIYRPKLICIEFNPTIPNNVNFVQAKDMSINQGSSALSLVELAKKKMYSPVVATNHNLFFVNNELKKYVTKKNYKINNLISEKNNNFVFVGYDGSIITSKKLILPWHGIIIKKIKFLPKILEKYPENYNILQKIILLFYRFYSDPLRYLKKLINIKI